jgi:hypothetical protein
VLVEALVWAVVVDVSGELVQDGDGVALAGQRQGDSTVSTCGGL